MRCNEDVNFMGVNNKLLCTFTTPDKVDDVVNDVKVKYTVLYDKIFVLESPDSEEMVVTYNVDFNNVSSTILPETIPVHRKKQTNTLYTIDALNSYISSKTNERYFNVDWNLFKNSILLTQQNTFKVLKTKINKIVNTNPQ